MYCPAVASGTRNVSLDTARLPSPNAWASVRPAPISVTAPGCCERAYAWEGVICCTVAAPKAGGAEANCIASEPLVGICATSADEDVTPPPPTATAGTPSTKATAIAASAAAGRSRHLWFFLSIFHLPSTPAGGRHGRRARVKHDRVESPTSGPGHTYRIARRLLLAVRDVAETAAAWSLDPDDVAGLERPRHLARELL